MKKMTTAFDVVIPDPKYINLNLLDEYIKVMEATYIDHIKWLFDLPEIYNSNNPDNEEDKANMEGLLKQKQNTETMMSRLIPSIDFLRNLKTL